MSRIKLVYLDEFLVVVFIYSCRCEEGVIFRLIQRKVKEMVYRLRLKFMMTETDNESIYCSKNVSWTVEYSKVNT